MNMKKTDAVCHPGRRVKAKGLCGSCYNSSLINRDPEHKAAILARKREQWKRRYSSKCSAARKVAQRNRVLKHRYGISQAEYNAMLASQGSSCAICNTPSSRLMQPLYVDHCHATKRVRGLLCAKCNTFVGFLEKRTVSIGRFASYISGPK